MLQVIGVDGLGERKAVNDVLSALQAGLSAVDPARLVFRHLRRRGGKFYINGLEINSRDVGEFVVLAVGKAAASMAEATLKVLGEKPVRGVVVVPHQTKISPKLKSLETIYAGHPVPDQNSVKAGETLLENARKTGESSFAIILVSGGSSALAAVPAEGITLEDKQAVTKALINAGATIHELNTVRKHLSLLKGGWLAKNLRCKSVSLILSDVVGDRLDVIGSGPTVPDPTTYREALQILQKYRIQAPANVVKRLEKGVAGEYPETPKPGDPAFHKITNVVIGRNADAVKAAAKELRKRKYKTVALTSGLVGEAREAAKLFAAIARDIIFNGIPHRPPTAVVAGGETTVTVEGTGVGGRNQELVLAAAIYMHDIRNFVFASIGTDGIDGVTDAAGALCTEKTYENALGMGLQPEKFLKNNDSHNFFKKAGGLVKTGPTGTNVGDLTILIVSGTNKRIM
ncbi:MAG: glycerate kinase [Candidatus Caldarchaeum sp.]|nr:glycerate kinase [Candidatus Caldarchaeum sp.]